MTTIMKMLFSIVSMVLKMTWKIVKFLSGPMMDSLKGLWKASWELYKKRKEMRANKPDEGSGNSEGDTDASSVNTKNSEVENHLQSDKSDDEVSNG